MAINASRETTGVL